MNRTQPDENEEYVPVLDPENPDDASLLKAASETFGDMVDESGEGPGMALLPPVSVPGDEITQKQLATEAEASAQLSENEVVQTAKPSDFGTPKPKDFVTVRGGGLYLPARRRLTWMRGEPVPHPDWTVDTYDEEVVKGDFQNGRVTGGYARYRASIFDAAGRLIGTGTKTEYSERFPDFVEKAETGAIARALAVAGYGTEAALDLDEGYQDDRIADAPVGGRPITISASNQDGFSQGGRSEHITAAQLNEIASRSRTLGLGLSIVPLIEKVLDTQLPDLPQGDQEASMAILEFLKGLSFDDAAKIVMVLNKKED